VCFLIVLRLSCSDLFMLLFAYLDLCVYLMVFGLLCAVGLLVFSCFFGGGFSCLFM